MTILNCGNLALGRARTASPSTRCGASKDTLTRVTKDTKLEEVPTPDDIKPLFEPVTVGAFTLSTRVVYAPLTRCRAENTIPSEFSIPYYKNRANKGQLMITEATVVHETGHGYPNTPGIYTDAQKEAWKPIVEGVHEKEAIFFCQLWHVGRISHSVYQPGGALPIAPSPVATSDDTAVLDPSTFQPLAMETPRAVDASEIAQLVEWYRAGARAAVAEVGFDGVEIHAGLGYIIDQFLKSSSNHRTDDYGGSIANRCRLCLEVLDAVLQEVGAERVGIRLSPYGTFNDAYDEDAEALYVYLCGEIKKRGIAYVHMIESRVHGNIDMHDGDRIKKETLTNFREASKPLPFIAAGGYQRDSASQAVATGHSDMVAIGRWALANADLLKRWKLRAPLNRYTRDTFYTPGPEGLTDYPLLEDSEHASDFFDTSMA